MNMRSLHRIKPCALHHPGVFISETHDVPARRRLVTTKPARWNINQSMGRRQRFSTHWNGSLPCALMFRTRESRWPVIMVTTAMLPVAGAKRPVLTTRFRALWCRNRLTRLFENKFPELIDIVTHHKKHLLSLTGYMPAFLPSISICIHFFF